MPRVVIFKQELTSKGGLEKATMRIAKAFVDKECEVFIVTATPQLLCPVMTGVIPVSFPVRWLVHFTQLTAWDAVCKSYASRHKADVILSFDRTTPQTHIRAGNGIHAAYLQRRSEEVTPLKKASFAINPLHRTILRLEKEAFASKALRRVIVNSAMVKDEAIEHYGVDPSLLQVIHNGVEWSEMESSFQKWPSLREEAAKEIGSDPGAFHFLFAGHEYGRKGLDHLLHGLSRLRRTDPRLIVIGRDKHIGAYKRTAEKLGLKHVYFLGPRKDLHRFYALADAAVIPSLYDPFANVTIEALAMGVFVVSSRFNGGSEVIDDSRGAIIENLHDPDSVATSLALALKKPKTEETARDIRYSVRHLDYPLHLSRFTAACLS